MAHAEQVARLLSQLKKLAPAGYAIAVHISYSTPKFLFQTYPDDWSADYTARGLVMHDPTVQWGFHNEGHVLWSDLAGQDPKAVLKAAARHGLRFGFTAALFKDESRSLAGFSRGDRPFTPDEIARIERDLHSLHDLTRAADDFSKAEKDALKALSVSQSQPS